MRPSGGSATRTAASSAWFLHGKGSKPDRVQELENRGVRPDAERQGQNRDQGESRVQTQQAKAVAQILPESRRDASRFVRARSGAGCGGGQHRPQRGNEPSAIELLEDRALGVGWRHAAREELLVPVARVLRELLGDRRLAGGVEPKLGKAFANGPAPVRQVPPP